ncbi:MAG: glycosyltransferase [Actinomycetota bacterium]
MTSDLRHERRAQGREQLAESVAAATRDALGAPIDEPDGFTIVAVPPARANPYQQMLYRNGLDHGIGVAYALDFDELAGLRWPYPHAFHIHWTRPVTRDATTTAEADARVDQVIDELDAARRRGTKLVWTIHNVVPHECAHVEADLRLRAWLTDHADLIHIMGESTRDAVADHYPLPESDRVVVVPHPSYVGVYPDHVSRREARNDLDLDPDATVALLFGSLRGYKGVDLLVEALDHVEQDLTVVLAGDPIDWETRRELRTLASENPSLELVDRRIATEDVQRFHRAADFALLPYQGGLNSGAALLAMSFDLPVVGPDGGSFIETMADGRGESFTPGDATSLAAAIGRAIERPGARDAVRTFAQAVRAEVVSDQFFSAVRSTLA